MIANDLVPASLWSCDMESPVSSHWHYIFGYLGIVLVYVQRHYLIKVINILADHHGTAVCILSIIMTCRKVGLYKKVFHLLKQLFPEFAPRQVMSDFEASLRKGFLAVFPTTRLLGCR